MKKKIGLRPDSPAHQKKGSQIRLRMHLRASRTLWILGALSGLQTPGRNGKVPQADRPAHQERVKKVECFLKTGRISIWNYSFIGLR